MRNLILVTIVTFGIHLSNTLAQSDDINVDSSFYFESFLDSTVLSEMDKLHIPGAVVTIVKHGNIVFNKGYGFADIETKREVDPKKSVFRTASISKPFTAIAIMKLVEEGKLKLHEDIRPLIENRYEFDWDHPLTIHQILTHTTGIDYSSIGSHKTEERIYDPKKKIKLLNQGHVPGDHFSYSNIAFGLLGYLIEKKSGLLYHSYMKDNILDPLQMVNSTFNTTLPSAIEALKAETYLWKDSQNNKKERQHLGVPAASSLESTGEDMAKFMIAVLHPSIFEELGIISLASFETMTTPQLPEISANSIGYSFLFGNSRNNPSIYHSGGVRGFLSIYNVFPSEDLGIYIAQSNRYGAQNFGWDINKLLQNKLLPEAKADLSWVQNQEERLIAINKFGGIFERPMHRNSTFEKAQKLLVNNEVDVDVLNDTTLSIYAKTFERIANTTFLDTRENSEWVIQFRENSNGDIIRMINGVESHMKINWYERIILTQVITGICFLVFIFRFIQMIRKLISSKKKIGSITQNWIDIIGIGYLLSFSALLVAYTIIETVKEGVPIGFKIPIIAITIFGILSLAFPWVIYKTIKSKDNLRNKLWNYLGIASIIFITALFYNLNLIGFMW